jgi:predicted signal transduction protein with EAL and GGDEF domain
MQTVSEAIEDNSLKTLEYQLAQEDITGSPLDGPIRAQWFEGRVHPIKDKNGEINSVIWLAINITERKDLEDQLKELSEKDGLTGAYNRRYFMQIFDKEFSIAKRYKNKLSILLIDIDS